MQLIQLRQVSTLCAHLGAACLEHFGIWPAGLALSYHESQELA
jgi:hypothetical protein